ncbi:MAG: AbrB/MazE/SpoVT family DNA-binding domain-containing protein [Nanoarchaeota archaeon]|nr:AbrB/MazE/SpoVT family DNA-binding domain-containing protein [Nanoarchaeota archaeon]
MKRKLIQMAGKTMVVSLPSTWVKKYGLKKGEEIELTEKGKNILIKTESEESGTSTQIDVTDLPKLVVERTLISAYTMGFDEIKLTYKNIKTNDLKTKKELNLNNLIEAITNNFSGVEIIEQDKTHTIIKQVSKISESEFDNVLRRMFFLLNSMSQETLEFIKTKDEDKKNIVNQKHDTIEKLSNYCLRLLNKKGHQNYKKTSLFYYLIFELEEIADIYNFIAIESSEKKFKYSKETLKLFEHVNDSWESFYKLFYKYDKEKLIEIIEDRRVLWQEINKIYKKASKADIILLGRISVIVIKILNLTETKMSMEL